MELINLGQRPGAVIAAFVALVIGVSISILLDEADKRRNVRRAGTNATIVSDAGYFARRLGRTALFRDGEGLLRRGYEHFSKKGKLWSFWAQNDELVTVLPPEACEEVKNIPKDRMEAFLAIEKMYKFSLHTCMTDTLLGDVVKYNLNNNLGRVHEFVVKRRDAIFSKRLAKADHGEPLTVPAWRLAWDIIHPLVADLAMGPEFMAQHPSYLGLTETYCKTTAFSYVYFLLPAILRRPFWWFSPTAIQIRRCIADLKAMLIPEVAARAEAARAGKGRRGDFLLIDALVDKKLSRGFMKRDKPAGRNDDADERKQLEYVAEELIFTSMEAVPPVVILIVQMVFETIANPALLEQLRDEISRALAPSQGQWTEQAMAPDSLPMLESFMRESLRVHSSAPYAVSRAVKQEVHLPRSGIRLYPGMLITTALLGVHTDPRFYPSPDKFDGLRFYDAAANKTTPRATTYTSNFLAFGYGAQACPGRFLGTRLAQLVFGKLILEYDIEFWPPREPGTRPANLHLPVLMLPDINQQIRIRKRPGPAEDDK